MAASVFYFPCLCSKKWFSKSSSMIHKCESLHTEGGPRLLFRRISMYSWPEKGNFECGVSRDILRILRSAQGGSTENGVCCRLLWELWVHLFSFPPFLFGLYFWNAHLTEVEISMLLLRLSQPADDRLHHHMHCQYIQM